jgi:ABC-2 type transport system ATP-binding protein
MIQVERLTKHYGRHVAIDRVTFHVEKGEIVGFLGPNGAGKTTTMRILTGFMPATSGTATVYDVFSRPLEVKRRIGYLPENPPLYNELTVTEYLRFVGSLKGVSRAELPSALSRALERCSLTEVRGRLIGNLSRGFRQRVGLAQALIHNPEVLILDEPTVGLDPKQIIEIRDLIRTLAGNHTVILSTHILPEATMLCQRVVIINEGRIVAVDTHERLSAQLRRSEKIHLILKSAPPETVSTLGAIPGVLQVSPDTGTFSGSANGYGFIVEAELGADIREELADCVVNRRWGLLEMRPVTLSLEDVFLKLTQEEPAMTEPVGKDP